MRVFEQQAAQEQRNASNTDLPCRQRDLRQRDRFSFGENRAEREETSRRERETDAGTHGGVEVQAGPPDQQHNATDAQYDRGDLP